MLRADQFNVSKYKLRVNIWIYLKTKSGDSKYVQNDRANLYFVKQSIPGFHLERRQKSGKK